MGGFSTVIGTVFPFATLVSERFHIRQMVNKQLKKLRNKGGVIARNSKPFLLKNNQDLSDEQLLDLSKILSQSPCLSMAYEMKEEFIEIYENSKTPKSGENKV